MKKRIHQADHEIVVLKCLEIAECLEIAGFPMADA